MRTLPTLPRHPARLLPALLLPIALTFAVASADDKPPAPPPPPPGPAAALEDSLQLGTKYFDQAIAWVGRGGALGKAREFYAHIDAQWDLPDRHEEGVQETWFSAPDKLRYAMTVAEHTTTKILNGDRAWEILTTGAVRRVHGTPDGEATLKQLKEDLSRVQDLTAFVTLEGLKGPGIVFEFERLTEGRLVYAGKWLKINRRSPDGRKMTFWIAYEADAEGRVVRATWPGVVRVDGDVAQKLHTEDWILKDWDSPSAKPRAFRYPMKVQGWRLNPDPAAAKTDKPTRFLSAIIDDIQINQGIDATRFEPPPGK